jgi:hypothetical protein
MKTIEEAAKEWSDKHYPKCEMHEDWDDDGFDEGYNAAANYKAMDAFKAGVEFAQRWNNATEVKPRPMEWVLVKFDVGIPPAVGRYTDDGYWNFPYYNGNDATINYWRYIELK